MVVVKIRACGGVTARTQTELNSHVNLMKVNCNSMQSGNFDFLRHKADQLMQGQKVDLKGVSIEEVDHLIQELQVYQTELRIRNKNLYKRHANLKETLARYYDLYHFAPVGYFIYDGTTGQIQDINLTGAELLGTKTHNREGRGIECFIAPESQHKFHHFTQRTFKMPEKI